MRSIVLADEADWHGWRAAARSLALQGVMPEETVWSVRAADDLFAVEANPAPAPSKTTFNVPKALVELSQTVIQARDPARFALMYRLLWRAHRGERHLMDQVTDPEVQRAQRLAQAVRRDIHKMRAFVRFRVVQQAGRTRHVAWFEPGHHIVESNADFFVGRFATMTWSILTPDRCAHWNGVELHFTPGAERADVPDDDALEAYWRAYFGAIFNPARLKIGAMTSEMPRKYWRNLPEAAAIPELIRGASSRVSAMVRKAGALPLAPAGAALLDPPRHRALDGTCAEPP